MSKTSLSSVATPRGRLQYLYAWSLTRRPIAGGSAGVFRGPRQARDHYAFGEELIHASSNIRRNRRKDSELAQNWEFDRIAKIDLAILRLAIFEMLFRKDIPPVVSINEAIDLSKQFSNADAKRFIMASSTG